MGTDEIELTCLHELVRRLVQESGNPEGFDVSAWLNAWVREPHPALGNIAPLELLRTSGGYERVRALFMRMQSGAFC
jgi:hypothetical protein